MCTAIEKRAQGNLVTEDMREKKQNNVKYDEETVNIIKSHIKSFPVMETTTVVSHQKDNILPAI